jgi:hypothetical protein
MNQIQCPLFSKKGLADGAAQAQARAGKGGFDLVQFFAKDGNGSRAMG